MAMKTPPHIGGFIRRQIVEPLSLTVTDAAAALGVTRQALNNLLNEKAALTAEMALRIEKAFGPKADHLLRMQLAYDLAQVRQQDATMNVRPVPQRLSPATGREPLRKQALKELAAAREQQRLGRRLIAKVAAGEMTAAEAAELLDVDAEAIFELVHRVKASQPPPRPLRPRASTPTR